MVPGSGVGPVGAGDFGRNGVALVASAFMLVGSAFFWIFAVGLALRPAVVLSAGFSAVAAAALHAAILGWLVPVGFAVTYFVLPRLGVMGGAGGLGFKAHFFLHVVGLGWVLAAFLGWDLGAVAHAGSLMFAGLVISLVLVAGRLNRGQRRPMVQITLATSFLWLMLTMFLGILAAANHYWYFLPLGTLKAVHAGLHAGFGGYLALMLMGLSYVLFDVPAAGGGERRLWAFLLCNAGLYAAVLGLAFGLPLTVPGVFAVGAGLIFYAVEVGSGIVARGVRPDGWLYGFAAGFGAMFLLLGMGLFVGEFEGVPAEARATARLVYGYLWIVLATGLPLWCIAGKMMAPGPDGGGSAAPEFSIALYVVAALIGAIGIAFEHLATIRLGGVLLLIAGMGLLAAIVPTCGRLLLRPGGAGQRPSAVVVDAGAV